MEHEVQPVAKSAMVQGTPRGREMWAGGRHRRTFETGVINRHIVASPLLVTWIGIDEIGAALDEAVSIADRVMEN